MKNVLYKSISESNFASVSESDFSILKIGKNLIVVPIKFLIFAPIQVYSSLLYYLLLHIADQPVDLKDLLLSHKPSHKQLRLQWRSTLLLGIQVTNIVQSSN